MRYLVFFFVLVFGLVSAGCVAAGAAAGAAAGSEMASDDARQDLEYWLKTNDTTTRIGRAMKEERLAKGMTPTHVKLVMDTKTQHSALPDNRDTTGTGMTWTYDSDISRNMGYEIVFNAEPVVEQVNRMEPDCEGEMTARGASGSCP